jgi:serine/threonine-protein kinase
LAIFGDAVIGLEHIHSKGIIHRDLKPSNILINGEGAGVVSDLGLAVLLERDTTTLTAKKQFLGTPHYAAPEQRGNAKDADKRADVYALALIAYEIARRTTPYTSVVLTGLHSTLQAVLQNALEQDRDKRTVTGRAIADALAAHVESDYTTRPESETARG